ncbi:MAG: hypothetical protein KIH62_000315 [Candidatus Kerfeldbacteria bacterium]|nr:hypothetical protein [Candidatus Kerfeldbacteria bacterium]
MQKFQPFQFTEKLSALGERQGKVETKAAALIRSELKKFHVVFVTEKFITHIPKFISAHVVADKKIIPAIPTSFVSGTITNKSAIVSSMISSQRFIDDANINFNPYCHTISRSNHYFAPSCAIAPEHLRTICDAKKVRAEVRVKKMQHESQNILIGNMKNPRAIFMGHYDSLGPGVIDNASGTALLMQLAIEHPEILHDNLLIIAGNEELSYDHPLYWGRGYRVCEKKHRKIFERAEKLIGVDCVGHAPTLLYSDPATVRLAIPLTHREQWAHKMFLLAGDLNALNPVYHSTADDGTLVPIQQKYLIQTKNLALKIAG